MLLLAGFILVMLGVVACQARLHDGWIPVNKNLWSFSFVLITAGLASWVMAWIWLVVDVTSIWSGHPFLQAGMNSIVIYVGVCVYDYVLSRGNNALLIFCETVA